MMIGYPYQQIMFGTDSGPLDAYNAGALNSINLTGARGPGMFTNVQNNPLFWEILFLAALILLISSHKISIEGMIGAAA